MFEVLSAVCAYVFSNLREHGRGFAVVVDEVCRLAEGSKSLTKDIVVVSAESVKINQIVETEVAEMLPRISESTDLVKEIVASTKSQTNSILEVNISIQQLNKVTQQNAASSEEMAANAEELSMQAESMSKLISYFK